MKLFAGRQGECSMGNGTGNARSPRLDRLVAGTNRVDVEPDRRRRHASVSDVRCSVLARNCGALQVSCSDFSSECLCKMCLEKGWGVGRSGEWWGREKERRDGKTRSLLSQYGNVPTPHRKNTVTGNLPFSGCISCRRGLSASSRS